MLINLSNHPLTTWSQKQVEQARALYGSIIDVQFPVVPPDATEDSVLTLAREYSQKCKVLIEQSHEKHNAVHVMGELTFTLAIVALLLKEGIECVASTTERIVHEENGVKVSQFHFVRFRRYLLP